VKANAVQELCASFPASTSDYPFGPDVRVYRVGGKIFALVGEDGADVSLKCDPAFAEVLRQNYAAISPGYHLNKRHWNTIALNGGVPDERVAELVEHAYGLVLSSLPKKEQARIAAG
jgi:predicted DNA-binding protein (MmcQ/YjbR family)